MHDLQAGGWGGDDKVFSPEAAMVRGEGSSQRLSRRERTEILFGKGIVVENVGKSNGV